MCILGSSRLLHMSVHPVDFGRLGWIPRIGDWRISLTHVILRHSAYKVLLPVIVVPEFDQH